MIRFGLGPGGVYNVDIDSPAGEARGTFEIPRSLCRAPADQLPDSPRDGEMRDAVPRNGKADVFEQKADVFEQEAGAELFEGLFQARVSKRFERSLGRLSGKDEGLRVLIEVDPERLELAAIQDIPWEFLYEPETGDFLALNRKTPVARSLRVPRERRSATSHQKQLRILALAASPVGYPPLDLERERQNLEKAWKGREKFVKIIPLQKTDREEIHRIFREAPIHVLHYMGHGSFDAVTGEGVLLLEGKDGTALPVSGRALAEDLKRFPDLRLVVLNACHTARSVGDAGPNPFAGVATALIMGGVPAVIAMSQPISDPAAVAFSKALYKSLAEGGLVEEATADARLAIHQLDERSGEWGTPVLFLREVPGPALTVRRVSFLAATVLASAVALFSGLGWFQDLCASKALRYNHEGIEHRKAGRIEEAREAFLAALNIDPDNAVALANLSVLEEGLGNYDEAVTYARAAAEAEPEEAIYRYNLANLLARLGRIGEALESFQETLRLKPGYAEARNELGNLYLELDRPAEARRELEAGIEDAPELASLHKNLARVELAEGRIDEAVRRLETALGLYDPADRQGIAEALYWLATAHFRAGHGDEACRRLEEVRHEAGAGQWVSEADRLAQQIPCRRVF